MIYDDSLPFEQYFSYHPVATPGRHQSHNAVNIAAMQFAHLVWTLMPADDPDRHKFLSEIQFIRMMLNHTITFKEVREQYAQDLEKPELEKGAVMPFYVSPS